MYEYYQALDIVQLPSRSEHDLDISINREFFFNSTAVCNSSKWLDRSTTSKAFLVNSLRFEETYSLVYRSWLQVVNQSATGIQMFKLPGLLPCQQVNNTGTSADP